jgi:glycosyltransferase involved in cell wall biosynthesis
VVEDPAAVLAAGSVPEAELARPEAELAADLHLYHVGNSPAHAYVYRAALREPGVLFLHDANLHQLVLHETVERGDRGEYLRQMRRSYGETGSFVGRQVARALGGELLPALFPLNERVLRESLAVVGLTTAATRVAAQRLQGRPVLQLAHHAWLPLEPVPTREAARAALGLRPHDFVITAPGLATSAKRLDLLIRMAAELAASDPALRLVIAGGVDPQLPLANWARAAGLGERLTITGRLELGDFVRQLAAADVIVALRFPSHGEMSGALMRALAVGRPVLVSSGSAAAAELPEGIVAPVDPGRHEEAQLRALLLRLRSDPALRESMSALARDHARRHHDRAASVARLAGFLAEVSGRKAELQSAVAAGRDTEHGLLGYLLDEAGGALRELGLRMDQASLAPLLRDLAAP